MYPPKFDYYRASSVEEAVSLLQEHDGAKLLAGGHSLIPVMNLRLADPGTLVDIGRIDSLRGIDKDNGRFRIGSLTTHATVAASEHNSLPAALKEAAGMIGDPQVRNRGTVGGNVSHADPSSDLPTVFTALGATFNMTGPVGSRSVAAANFFTELFETALNDDEILTGIEVPAEAAETGSAYTKTVQPRITLRHGWRRGGRDRGHERQVRRLYRGRWRPDDKRHPRAFGKRQACGRKARRREHSQGLKSGSRRSGR